MLSVGSPNHLRIRPDRGRFGFCQKWRGCHFPCSTRFYFKPSTEYFVISILSPFFSRLQVVYLSKFMLGSNFAVLQFYLVPNIAVFFFRIRNKWWWRRQNWVLFLFGSERDEQKAPRFLDNRCDRKTKGEVF